MARKRTKQATTKSAADFAVIRVLAPLGLITTHGDRLELPDHATYSARLETARQDGRVSEKQALYLTDIYRHLSKYAKCAA